MVTGMSHQVMKFHSCVIFIGWAVWGGKFAIIMLQHTCTIPLHSLIYDKTNAKTGDQKLIVNIL